MKTNQRRIKKPAVVSHFLLTALIRHNNVLESDEQTTMTPNMDWAYVFKIVNSASHLSNYLFLRSIL